MEIRTASLTYEIGRLDVRNGVLLPGTPIDISFEPSLLREQSGAALLLLRLVDGTLEVAQVEIASGGQGPVQVKLPCDVGESVASKGAAARLVLIEEQSQAVLAQSQELKLLPPGPDCAWR
jgi:hypothetical protein